MVDAVSPSIMRDAVELLQRLVQIPSFSGKEDQAASFLVSYLAALFPGGVTRQGHTVIITIDGARPGPT
ncbi:MAG: hypothetical protein EBZ48_05875, partial [Proteobacteria bacterium]|nr:hypothetical protein [Pseudomonadota bacterium]